MSDLVTTLYFGCDDAETDAVDGLLHTGFLTTSAYQETLRGRKSLIIGRKGSGKSAICMRLAMPEASQRKNLLITPDDTASAPLRGFELAGLTDAAAKSLIWRYVFAIHIARHLVSHHARWGHDRPEPKSVKRVRRFLRANGELADPQPRNRIATATKDLRGSLVLEAFGLSLTADLNAASEGMRASAQLAVIENGISQALEEWGCAQAHQAVLLLVDKIEDIWTAESSSEATITGLLLASKRVARTYAGAARCVVFLRSDIYDMLTFSEADKFHSNELRIDWSREQLVKLAVARASASLGEHVTSDYLWRTVFPEHVNGQPIVDYLFSRMLPRPRDTIQFLNLCRDEALTEGCDRIAEHHVFRATVGFSRWKTFDLIREYGTTLPFLEQVLTLLQHGPAAVSRDLIAYHLTEFGDALRARYPRSVDLLTPDGIVDVLFRVGFLGVLRGGKVDYVTNASLPLQPHENEFQVHPCFLPALALTPTRVADWIPAAYGAMQNAVLKGDWPAVNIIRPTEISG